MTMDAVSSLAAIFWPTFSSRQVFAKLRCVTVICVVLIVLAGGSARAQAPWEFSPYRVNIGFGCDPSTDINSEAKKELARTLIERAEASHGAAWTTTASPVAPALNSTVASELSSLTFEEIEQKSPESLDGDKLILATIERTNGRLVVHARELDCRTRQWSSTFERTAASTADLPLTVWDTVMLAFTPLATIESVDGRNIIARARAGSLVTNSESPLLIRVEDVLKPIVRRNDRSGRVATGGILAPEWTLLRVLTTDHARLQCQLVSGFRGPIPVKGGVRTERLALVVRPTLPETRLVLMSRTKPARPLGGYQVYTRQKPDEEPILLGVTGLDGSLILPATDGHLQPLLIRSGGQLLARLPLVPGQAADLVATVVDDDGRLQAEGFVLAFQSRVMDLVARRELLASQFRKRLAAGKLEEARAVLEQYRLLETRADLSRVLDQQQQQITSNDRTTQVRIQKLFSDARKLLLKFLDPEKANELTRELAAARSRAPNATPASAPAPAKPSPAAKPEAS
jgi:hypothetical protein